MHRANFQYSFSDLKIDATQIERFMGYKEGESDESVYELTARLLKEVGSIVRIKAEYAVFDAVKFNDPDKSVRIDDVVFDLKKIVFGQIKRADAIAIFLCTAGREIGDRSRIAMKEGDLLTGYIYDVIGSEIVEAASDLVQADLEHEMLMVGRKITNRYSPGYCGWNVEEQHKLFSFFTDNYCGISLTPSALMDPVKSVSGFIGIGEHVRYNPYTCRLCDMKDCIYRNRKA
jgi:hypothetical protein